MGGGGLVGGWGVEWSRRERGFLEIHTVAYVNPHIVYRWRIPRVATPRE